MVTADEAREKARAFYDQHYEVVGHWLLQPGKKVVLGSKASRRCRFCGHSEPQATFKLVAHAIPEALGNKSLSTNYECDACNQLFGGGIEDQFGKWSKPLRTFARIRGKSGVPTLSKGSQGGWRVEHSGDQLNIKEYEYDPIFEVKEETKQVVFTLKRDPYTPIAVLKALVKMGLTLLPESEVVHFTDMLAWIRETDHANGRVGKLPAIYAFVPGALPNDRIELTLLRRKDDTSELPYMFFVLGYGNEVFQVPLPSREKDGSNIGKNVSIPPYARAQDASPHARGPVGVTQLDLSGTTPERKDVVLTCGYETGGRVPPSAPGASSEDPAKA